MHVTGDKLSFTKCLIFWQILNRDLKRLLAGLCTFLHFSALFCCTNIGKDMVHRKQPTIVLNFFQEENLVRNPIYLVCDNCINKFRIRHQIVNYR
ncbi:hypothetical protein CW304_12215 [Bacillus sp. UFRGS-B20]|nr:hypothetical protein CW304_12215 [Bacillus sp. UFRGS-B20]